MLIFFRLLSILEGISYLLLFAVTMPLKYKAGIKEPNIYVGYAHGSLFIGFIVFAAIFCYYKKWSIKRFIIFLIASFLPFGTFYTDKKYLKTL